MVEAELEIRLHHHDENVKKIAKALLNNLHSSEEWIIGAIKSAKHHSDFQKVLMLEKIVLHFVLKDLWRDIFSGKNIKRIKDPDWNNIVKSIPIKFAQKYIQKPIQTHRIERYENLLKYLNKKIKITQPMVILDAGACLGAGASAAKELNIPIKKWIALDINHHNIDIAWIMTSSFRFGEIKQKKLIEKLQRYFKQPNYVKHVSGDMQKLKMNDNTIDIYMANFSFYQLPKPEKAFKEAIRVVKPGGYILITDKESQSIRTQVYTKNLNGSTSLIDIQTWKDTDLNK